MMELTQARLTQFIQTPFRYFPSIGSTNDEALRWLREGAPKNALVVADEQTQGRGRMGRVWHTPPNVALALSFILHPQPHELNRISMLGGVVVAELCEHLGIAHVGIKYPNDVQINGKKVCGVLPEAAWDEDRLIGVVLGMGVNVRVQFDTALQDSAINLETAVRRTLDRAELVQFLVQRVHHWAAHLSSADLFSAWQTRLTTIGQTVSIGTVHGVAVGVDSEGALLVQTADGSQERVIAGDVMIIDS
jgi:BirA family biotin operon repressor/biotin-[acetyl-CoA-carboxylase] ligase